MYPIVSKTVLNPTGGASISICVTVGFSGFFVTILYINSPHYMKEYLMEKRPLPARAAFVHHAARQKRARNHYIAV